MTPATARVAAADLDTGVGSSSWWRVALTGQVTGPLAALILAVVIFSTTTESFFSGANLALVVQQSVVVGTLAIGQTLVVLTAGIDLACAAIMVMGSVVIGRIAVSGNVWLALLAGVVVTVLLGAVNGSLVSFASLPPFIVTLGVLTALTAGARLFTDSASYPIKSTLLTALNHGPRVGGVAITYGAMAWIGLTILMAYALTQTKWGTRIYTVGDNPQAAELVGIDVKRVLFGVYVVAGLIYAIAAWQALGRTPTADPAGYPTANLDSITAVVIGGTSLFGGRGGVAGTLVGTLIVTVLQNGLTHAGIDSLYQQVATGVLVVLAVAVDRLTRTRQSR